MPFIAPAVSSIALNLAIGIGASVLANVFRPQQTNKRQQVTTSRGLSFDVEVGEGASVSGVFGLGRAAGQLVYVNEYGTNNDYLQMVQKIGHGWHDGLDAFLVDEKPVALSGSNGDPRGRAVVPYILNGEPYMWVKAYAGAPGQAADPQLVAQANPAGRWTAAHKMTGCAYLIITMRFHPDLFNGPVPLLGSVWRGLKLFDWRVPGAVWGDQSTYVFTKNPVVIRQNFRRGIFVNGVRVLGMGFPAAAQDLAGYTAAANRCDEDFFDPVTEESFPIYEFGRSVSDDEEKLSILQELDDSYCGGSMKRGGAEVPLPAQQLIPVMTLTDGDRLAGYPVRADRWGSRSQKKTMWHGQFVSSQTWTETPFSPRIDADMEALIGGRRSVALNQPYEYLAARAQLRAEMALRRQFFGATRVETFVPKSMVLEVGDCVQRVCEWGTMLMTVEKIERLPSLIGATVTFTEWSNTIVPASGDTFVTLPTSPGAGPANPNRTIAVSGLNVVPYSKQGGGAIHPYGRATWTPITDTNVDQVLVRVWPSAGTEADDGEDFFADSKLTSAKLVGPLQPLTEYSFKAIPIRSDGRVCVWTNVGTFTTGAETVPADIADDSVTIDKLVQEVRNQLDFVMSDLPARLAQVQADIEAQAAAGLDAQATNRKKSTLLAAQLGSAVAAVIREEAARVEDNAAFAMALLQVSAEIENFGAGGLLSFEVLASEAGVSSTIALMTRVETIDEKAESGIRIETRYEGGVLQSELLLLTDKLIVTDGVNTAQALTFEGGVLKILAARAGRITSADETSMILDFDDPLIELTGGP